MSKNACCLDEVNLGPVESTQPERPELIVRRCIVCGAKHYTLSVDPVVFGLTGVTI